MLGDAYSGVINLLKFVNMLSFMFSYTFLVSVIFMLVPKSLIFIANFPGYVSSLASSMFEGLISL